MRPELLFQLFAPVTSLSGVGPKSAKLIEKVAGKYLVDLLWHLPSNIIDRRYSPNILDAEPGKIATLVLTVGKHRASRARIPYKIECFNDTGTISLVFFHAREKYLREVLPEGEQRVVSGLIEIYEKKLQITHPDQIGTLSELDQMKSVHPVYSLTQGLSLNVITKVINKVTEKLPDIPEWIDQHYIAKQKWPSWKEAVSLIHKPKNYNDLKPSTAARQRLAFDQLLASQLALCIVRNQVRQFSDRFIPKSYILIKKLKNVLPFTLTASQQKAIDEIIDDTSSNRRMHRLLQGDVGSGKTIVSLLGMAPTIEAGYQVALLAPTEILARQHFATIEPLATKIGLSIDVYTGRDKGTIRKSKLNSLKNGGVQLVIGTHTLFQEEVQFKNLGMAIIDEQHRFGVHQRLALSEKGHLIDLLVMSATPIPRTLTLTAYGDMDISRLTEKPKDRLPIDTRTVSIDRLSEVVSAVVRALDKKNKIYWVCPLIEGSESIDLVAAKERYHHLKNLFGNRVGLLHGKLKGPEKDKIMDGFSHNKIDLLVTTTVIEVGVDIPEATIMVVEQAERFGLSQLHQLRGRIGRGSDKSTCLLMYNQNLSANARQRLKVLRETEDGFQIAEKDLLLRGAGDLLGTRQSGLPEFKLVNFDEHGHLTQVARDYAKMVLNKDPLLSSALGKNLRLLLYLFKQDAGIKLLRKA